jgi:hypothetical protein
LHEIWPRYCSLPCLREPHLQTVRPSSTSLLWRYRNVERIAELPGSGNACRRMSRLSLRIS